MCGQGGYRLAEDGAGSQINTSTRFLIRQRGRSGGFCCQVPPNPACRSLTRQDFKIGIPNRLRGLGNRSIVVVGNYGMARYVGTISGKSTSFTPSSILFRPRRCSAKVQPYGQDRPHRDGA